MKRRISTLLLLALGLIFCSGCMTYYLYDGERRPQGKTGIIKLGVIRDIDGSNFQYLTGHDLVVLPNRYTLGLLIKRRKTPDSICSFDVQVEAGHVYQGVVEWDKSRNENPPVIYVLDRTANIVVAREPPLPPAPAEDESALIAPSRPVQADQNSIAQRSAPVPTPHVTETTPPRRHAPLDPEKIEELRRLRQLKDGGLITHEEYVRLGKALVATP